MFGTGVVERGEKERGREIRSNDITTSATSSTYVEVSRGIVSNENYLMGPPERVT